MKTFGTILTFLFILSFSSCKDEVVRTRTYHRLTPFYLSVSDLRKQTISLDKPQKLSAPGKIYIYGNFLFINELSKGIHIVDNTDPASPHFINFISIPGNIDMAVNSNVLYADSYVDLLAFDISNPASIILANRVENVFDNQYLDKSKGLILGYKDTVITEVISHEIQDNSRFESISVGASFDAASSLSQSYGTGGSTARFTLMNSSLYTVSNNSLKLFNVSAPKQPVFVNTINLGAGIETTSLIKISYLSGQQPGCTFMMQMIRLNRLSSPRISILPVAIQLLYRANTPM